MEGIEIGKVIAEFVLTVVVLYLCNEQIKTLKDQIEERDERIKRLESSLEKCNEAHQRDLRGWAGIEAWSRRDSEEDTRRFISKEKQQRLREEWEKHQNNLSETD
jgi:hypothetical protein